MKVDFIKCACIVVSAIGAVVGLYIFMIYLLPALFPFIAAYLIACLACAIAKRLMSKRKVRPAVNIAVTFIILGGTITVASLGIYRIGVEVTDFASALTAGSGEDIISDIEFEINNIALKLPIVSDIVRDGGDIIGNLVDGLTGALGEEIPSLVGKVLSSAPRIMLAFIVAVIASFYFSYDLDGINEKLKSLLPRKMRDSASRLKAATTKLFIGYARAYLILMVIVFAIVAGGLLAGGVKYAFLLAFLIALLDVLPAIGVGAVLVPWGIISLMRGDIRLGASLLLTYAVVTVVRQLCESRLVGAHIGVHPLFALFCMFVGFSLFGFIGLFVGAIAGAIVTQLVIPELRYGDRASNV